MPIGLHLLLGALLQFGTLFGFAALLIYSQLSATLMAFVIVAGFLVMFSVRILFRRLFPASCKKCGGRAFCKGSRPIYFECADCEHIHDTGWCEGGSGGGSYT